MDCVDSDADKINILKKLGIWQSVRPLDINYANGASYTFYNSNNKRIGRLVIDFELCDVMTSKESRNEFLSNVFDAIKEMEEQYKPDLPDRIKLL